MNRTDAIACDEFRVCSAGQPEQKTPTHLAVAVLKVARGRLAEIGRQLPEVAAKQGIKQGHRLLANRQVVISDAMQAILGQIARHRGRKALTIALNWMASVVAGQLAHQELRRLVAVVRVDLECLESFPGESVFQR